MIFLNLSFKVLHAVPSLMALGAAISAAHGIQALIEQVMILGVCMRCYIYICMSN